MMRTKAEKEKGIARWAGQMIGALIVFGAILFLCASRLNWVAGWVYLGINAFTQAFSALVLIPRQSEMLAERSSVREGTKGYDRFLAPAVAVFGSLAVIVTAGLDARFGWSAPFPTGWWVFGLVLAFASQMFVLWAMASNPFFSTTVRIQEERGHSAIQSGPYRLVRHPGYAGSVIYNLTVPVLLTSFWTFIPALLTILLLIVRTRLEDGTLQAELPGYLPYSEMVRYRLMPGIW